MRIPRIYCDEEIVIGDHLELDGFASRHILRVLRLKKGETITLFNGRGGEYRGKLVTIDNRKAVVLPEQFIERDVESPLNIHLGQAISLGDHMDFAIQKAVELGVAKITPLFTERGNLKLSAERIERRLQHWRKIVISACEQCGRNILPEVAQLQVLDRWLAMINEDLRLVLDHNAGEVLTKVEVMPQSVALLIGPEGGLTASELERANQHDFQAVCLGKRVFRTETAAIVAVSVLQMLWGDFK